MKAMLHSLSSTPGARRDASVTAAPTSDCAPRRAGPRRTPPALAGAAFGGAALVGAAIAAIASMPAMAVPSSEKGIAAIAAPTGEVPAPTEVDIAARLAAPPVIVELVDSGDFKGADAAIAAALDDASLDAGQRTALEFQRERMRRILIDF